MSLRSVIMVLLVCGLAGGATAQTIDRGRDAVCGRRGNLNNLESVGLTEDGRLVCFRERQPGRAREIGAIGGLEGGEMIIAIDFRPANGLLYGLGNAGGIYTIDTESAMATKLSTLTGPDGAPVPLMGVGIGIDFNPVPDRLRIVTTAGQNLRVNVDTGATLIDKSLTNPQGGPEGGVSEAAYTNNDASPNTNTVLYDLDVVEDQFYIQAPPNAGSLNQVGLFGTDIVTTSGFDIFSVVRDGRTVSVRAIAAAVIGDQTRMFRVNLTNGELLQGAAFSDGNTIIDFAIPLTQGD